MVKGVSTVNNLTYNYFPMLVESISNSVFPKGPFAGRATCMVSLSKKGQEMEINDVVKEVLSSSQKLVTFKGKLVDNPEVRTILQGLVSKGKTCVLVTDASDSIETIRNIRNCFVYLITVPPSEESNHHVNAKNFPLLKQGDVVALQVKDVKAYDDAVVFVKSRLITKPTVLFEFKEEEDRSEILEKRYFDDEYRFTFDARII